MLLLTASRAHCARRRGVPLPPLPLPERLVSGVARRRRCRRLAAASAAYALGDEAEDGAWAGVLDTKTSSSAALPQRSTRRATAGDRRGNFGHGGRPRGGGPPDDNDRRARKMLDVLDATGAGDVDVNATGTPDAAGSRTRDGAHERRRDGLDGRRRALRPAQGRMQSRRQAHSIIVPRAVTKAAQAEAPRLDDENYEPLGPRSRRRLRKATRPPRASRPSTPRARPPADGQQRRAFTRCDHVARQRHGRLALRGRRRLGPKRPRRAPAARPRRLW